MGNRKEWTEKEVRELIHVVQANPVLYDKTEQDYKDNQHKKMAWDIIACVLQPPCTRDEAKKKFKNLRDTFGKECRKLMMKKLSGSAGGAAQQITWEFYGDLAFLEAHITPRKTFSNEDIGSSPSIDLPQPDETVLHDETEAHSLVPVHLGPDESPQPSPQPSPPACPDELAGSSQSSLVIRTKALQSLVVTSASPYERKAQKEDPLEGLVQSATSLAKALLEKQNSEPSTSARSDSPLSMLDSVWKLIPSEKHLQCTIYILKVADIYQNGGGPCTISDSTQQRMIP